MPSLSDLRYLYYGGGSSAEYEFLKQANADGITASKLIQQASRRVLQEHDLLSFSNSSAQNTLFNFTVPGGQAEGGVKYKFTVFGDLQNTGGAQTIIFRVTRNAVIQFHSGAISIPVGAGADFAGFKLEFNLFIDNDFDLNAVAKFQLGGYVVAGVSAEGLSNRLAYRQESLVEADWASNVTIGITAQWSTAVTNQIRRQIAEMETTLTTPG